MREILQNRMQKHTDQHSKIASYVGGNNDFDESDHGRPDEPPAPGLGKLAHIIDIPNKNVFMCHTPNPPSKCNTLPNTKPLQI